MQYYSGKRIWIIGASDGIGAALAKRLSDMGAMLALSARNAQALYDLQAKLAGSRHLVLPLDVTNQATLNQAWKTLTEAWVLPDIILYNAGTYEPLDAKHFDLAKIEFMMDVNFSGALRTLSLALPAFIQANRGQIALVGSVAGYRGLPAAMGYGASKAALIHLAENLKADLQNTALKIQIINPGFVATRLTAKNTFAMPFILTPERAANYMVSGLASARFEIHFPKRFSLILKALSLLPNRAYFAALKRFRF